MPEMIESLLLMPHPSSIYIKGLLMQAQGANCECNGQVWRVDVGMSSGVLNAIPQVSQRWVLFSGAVTFDCVLADMSPACYTCFSPSIVFVLHILH